MKNNLHRTKYSYIFTVSALIILTGFANLGFAKENKPKNREGRPSNSSHEEVLTLTPLNKKIRSTNESGATYILDVKNNSSNEINARVSVENYNTEIENPDESAATENVELEFLVHLISQQTPVEFINLKSGDSYQLEITAKAIENTPTEKWNCARVEIIPSSQKLKPAMLILHTFVNDINTRLSDNYK